MNNLQALLALAKGTEMLESLTRLFKDEETLLENADLVNEKFTQIMTGIMSMSTEVRELADTLRADYIRG